MTVLIECVKHLIMVVVIPATPRPDDRIVWEANDVGVYNSKSGFHWLLDRSTTMQGNPIWI